MWGSIDREIVRTILSLVLDYATTQGDLRQQPRKLREHAVSQKLLTDQAMRRYAVMNVLSNVYRLHLTLKCTTTLAPCHTMNAESLARVHVHRLM